MITTKRRWLFLIVVLVVTSLSQAPQSLVAQVETDDQFLNMIESHSWRYFWQEANPTTGLIKDSSYPASPCSVASQGLGLAAICVAVEREWIPRQEGYRRVEAALQTMSNRAENKNGFFYHFIDLNTGQRVWSSEVSSLDTAIFIAGALTAGSYFEGTRVETLANELYDRVDWTWMMNGGNTLCQSWKPESGFQSYRWDSYSEAMLAYILAIGSRTHPIEAGVWDRIRHDQGAYPSDGDQFVYSSSGSLFAYQLTQAFFDFRGLEDRRGVNYFENSVAATRANRRFCIDQQEAYPTYSASVWGITASLGPEGYRAYGAEPGNALHDGTVAPCAAAGSLPFAPYECIETLRAMHRDYENRIYDPAKYGFRDAFNVGRNWWCRVYIGIDQGITVVMIENYRTNFVWNQFMKTEAARRFSSRCLVSAD